MKLFALSFETARKLSEEALQWRRTPIYQMLKSNPCYGTFANCADSTPFYGTLIAVVLACFSTSCFGDNVKVESAWLQAVPPVAEATAAYMKITNLGQKPLKLIGAFSPIATRIEPMITARQQRNGREIMGMESVSNLEIPAGGVLVLKPGGNHLMMMGLTSHPKEGERVKLTLRFAPGDQRLDVELPVFKQEP